MSAGNHLREAALFLPGRIAGGQRRFGVAATRLLLASFAAWLAGTVAANAQSVHHSEVEPPLYPEIIIETDDSFSSNAGLTAFREVLIEASETRATTSWGKVLHPDAVLPFLADAVEFLIGPNWRNSRDEFVSLGLHPARTALEMAGRMSRGSASPDSSMQARYGMYAIGDLAGEPTVGRTPWLDGRICAASYGRIPWPDWVALDAKLRFIDRRHWAIAAVVRWEGVDGLPRTDWPKPYQMVPVSPEQKRSGGSLGILAPDGDVVFFRSFFGPAQSYFAPYLNSHLCFEKQERSWKVTAIAMRLD